MSAWRQAGTSTLPLSSTGGLSSGVPSSQKPSARACSSLTHSVRVTSSSDWASWSASRTSSGEPAPGARLRAQLGEREALEAGLDRQQQQRGRLVAAPAELDRTHRRAARRRRQDAPAGVGEEDGVDELGLAARELGDEGDDQLFVTKPLAQRRDLLGRLAVGEVLLAEKTRERFDALAQGGTPAAEGVETGGE